jgi:hypothetical protein
MTYTPIVKGTQNWDVPLNAALATLDADITSASGTALQATNNLSDLTNVSAARANLNLTGLANALSNMTATTNPTVSSDNTQGYSIGSTWFNTTTNALFIASKVTTGAAVWLQIPPTFVDLTSVQTVAGVKTFTSPMNSTHSSDESSFSASYTATNTTNGAYAYIGNAATGRFTDARVTGDSVGRFVALADGTLNWGSGSATRDTNLYRGGADLLKTDDDFQAANFTPGAWTTYTSAWTSSGTAPAIGNGTISARYSITGNTVNVAITLAAGGSTTFGTGTYSFSLPFAAATGTGISTVGNVQIAGTARWAGHAVLTAGGSTMQPFMSTSATDPRLTAMSGTAPETLTTSVSIRITIAYEMA